MPVAAAAAVVVGVAVASEAEHYVDDDYNDRKKDTLI